MKANLSGNSQGKQSFAEKCQILDPDPFCLQQQAWYFCQGKAVFLGSQIHTSMLLSHWEPCLAISVISCRIRAFSVCLVFNWPLPGKNCQTKEKKISLLKATKQPPHKHVANGKSALVTWPCFLSLSVNMAPLLILDVTHLRWPGLCLHGGFIHIFPLSRKHHS